MQLKDITKTHRALIAFGGDGSGNQPVVECPAKLIAGNPDLARERAISSEGMIYQARMLLHNLTLAEQERQATPKAEVSK